MDKVHDSVHVFKCTFAEIKYLDPKTDKLKDFIDIDNRKIAQDSINSGTRVHACDGYAAVIFLSQR